MRARSDQPGFTMTELLVVTAVLGILATLTIAAVSSARISAKRVQCVSNLRQLGLAAQMYWDDNDQRSFAYSTTRTQGGVVYWFGWLGKGAEGQRQIDHSMGALWPYLKGQGIELCPAFQYRHPLYKPKASGASYGYGYNLHLADVRFGSAGYLVPDLPSPVATTLFADSAQINDFQRPASQDHPLVEEFYYVNHGLARYANAHFRHLGTANVVFCDGHVGAEDPVPGTRDLRLPSMNIARLRRDILIPNN